eukprot:GHVT01103769.1.p1 GENE.GHVT01103769.1~~GHVT01103769.1.p1  ORF type:complete len:656 (-),score=79.75 GHVT01103769.1:289-2136(-)
MASTYPYLRAIPNLNWEEPKIQWYSPFTKGGIELDVMPIETTRLPTFLEMMNLRQSSAFGNKMSETSSLVAQPKPTVQPKKTNGASSGAADGWPKQNLLKKKSKQKNSSNHFNEGSGEHLNNTSDTHSEKNVASINSAPRMNFKKIDKQETWQIWTAHFRLYDRSTGPTSSQAPSTSSLSGPASSQANDASSITTDASIFPLSKPVTVEEKISTGAPSVAASNTLQLCEVNNTRAPGSDSLNLNSDCPEPDQSPQQKLQTQGGHSSNKPVNTCITDVKSSESTTSPTSSSAPSTSSLSGPASPEEHQHTTLTNGAWQIYHQNTKEKLEEIQSITAHCNSSDVSSTTRVVMIYPSPVTKQKKEQKANSLVSVTDQEGQSKAENSLVAGQKKKQKIGIFGKAITRLQRSFRNSPNSKEKKKSKIKSISKETSSQGPTSSNTSLSGWPLAKQTSAGAARSRSAIGESSAPGAVEISLRAATSNSVGDQVRLDLSEQPFSVTTNSDAGRTNEINPTLKRQLVIASFALGLSSLFSLTGWAIWKRKMSGSQRCPKRYTSTQKMTSVEEASSTLRSGSVAVATRLQRGRPGEKGAVTQMGQPAARLHSLDATKPANGLQSD